MVNLPTLRTLRMKKNKWLACEGLHSLHHLLRLPPGRLAGLENSNTYTVFSLPKKTGGFRMIENPSDSLKALQRQVNDYLQAVHYFIRHPAAYGFCQNARNDKEPYTVFTHALRHTGCNYLLNMDMKDFFHTVTYQKIYDLLNNGPFIHDDESIQWLCRITTHGGRLPMGAPTSPVLSNLASLGFDGAMENLAKRSACTYTRFADDISFSSVAPYPSTLQDEALEVIREHGYIPNMEKIKAFGKNDTKIITGLQVGEKVSLAPAYWNKVEMLLGQLTALQCLLLTRPSVTVHNQAEDIREKINGFLAFASMIGGAANNHINRIQSQLDNMDENLEDYESLHWDDIPYQF